MITLLLLVHAIYLWVLFFAHILFMVLMVFGLTLTWPTLLLFFLYFLSGLRVTFMG